MFLVSGLIRCIGILPISLCNWFYCSVLLLKTSTPGNDVQHDSSVHAASLPSERGQGSFMAMKELQRCYPGTI